VSNAGCLQDHKSISHTIQMVKHQRKIKFAHRLFSPALVLKNCSGGLIPPVGLECGELNSPLRLGHTEDRNPDVPIIKAAD